MFGLMIKKKGYELIKIDELAEIKKSSKTQNDFVALYVELEKQYKTDSMNLASENELLSSELKQAQSDLAKALGEREAFKAEVDKHDRKLKAAAEECFKQSYEDYKRAYIDHHMLKIDHDAHHGSGSYYEIYEERRQNAIDDFVDRNIDALSGSDIYYIKKQYGYESDHEPYTEVDEVIGETMTIWDIVRKQQE